jgi:hypothetical protein
MTSKLASVRESFELILPDAEIETDTFVESFDFLAAAEPTKVTAFHGFSAFKGIKIESQGFDVEGTLKGRVRTHNFVKLYQVYNLPKSSGWKLWALEFKKDKSQSVLRQTFQEEDQVDLAIDMKFSAPANALGGVTFLRVGFETIKLKLGGVEKSFTVVNPDSGGGRDEEGNEIDVEFEEI